MGCPNTTGVKYTPWEPDEIEYLLKHSYKMTDREIAKKLNRSRNSVSGKRWQIKHGQAYKTERSKDELFYPPAPPQELQKLKKQAKVTNRTLAYYSGMSTCTVFKFLNTDGGDVSRRMLLTIILEELVRTQPKNK